MKVDSLDHNCIPVPQPISLEEEDKPLAEGFDPEKQSTQELSQSATKYIDTHFRPNRCIKPYQKKIPSPRGQRASMDSNGKFFEEARLLDTAAAWATNPQNRTQEAEYSTNSSAGSRTPCLWEWMHSHINGLTLTHMPFPHSA